MSVIENLRHDQELLEWYEKAVAHLLTEIRDHPSKRIELETAIREILSKMEDTARRVLRSINDHDGLRRSELDYLAGINKKTGKNDVWMNFYSRIRSIKEYHRNLHLRGHQLLDVYSVKKICDEAMRDRPLDVIFSPEEREGRYIDLAHCHMQFTNIKKLRKYFMDTHFASERNRLRKKVKNVSDKHLRKIMEPYQDIDYVQYLRTFNQFHQIPRYCKYREQEYEDYINNLGNTLSSFFKRIYPLSDYNTIEEILEKEFSERWENDVPLEWKAATHAQPLYSRPLNILLATQGTFEAHKNGKKYKKALRKLENCTPEELNAMDEESRNIDRRIAQAEARIHRYKDILAEAIERTIGYVHKRQSRSGKELAEESGEDEKENAQTIDQVVDEGSELDEEEKPVYNPLNLPLGWDGKPIPYWLYKLHGLGQEFKCEICGNYSYWGRRAFERHFSEWRHAFGMRCLKIPNTTHFKEITSIDDAVKLYEKLRKEADTRIFKTDQEAECEDAEGNIMSARAYADLSRQGLL